MNAFANPWEHLDALEDDNVIVSRGKKIPFTPIGAKVLKRLGKRFPFVEAQFGGKTFEGEITDEAEAEFYCAVIAISTAPSGIKAADLKRMEKSISKMRPFERDIAFGKIMSESLPQEALEDEAPNFPKPAANRRTRRATAAKAKKA